MPDAPAATLSWPRLALLIAGRAYRACLLVLVAVALAPLVLGWSSYAVRTGSMEPSIGVGDIVVAQPLPADTPPAVGRVMVFADPASDDGRLLVHRVVADLDDGTYATAGDANPLPDATPVPRDAFEARGVLLAPYAGLPLTWLQNGNVLALALWLGVTIAAFVLASDPTRTRRRWRLPRRRFAIAAAVGVTLTLVLAATAAVATFTSTTVTGSNTLDGRILPSALPQRRPRRSSLPPPPARRGAGHLGGRQQRQPPHRTVHGHRRISERGCAPQQPRLRRPARRHRPRRHGRVRRRCTRHVHVGGLDPDDHDQGRPDHGVREQSRRPLQRR